MFTQHMPVYAQSGLVPCGTEKEEIKTTIDANGVSTDTGGDIINPCQFEHLFELVNKVINYVFTFLVVPIAAIIFAISGFKLLFSGGNSSKMAEAKKSMINVAIGLAVAAGAWLIIHTLLNILGYTGLSFGL